jgi:hypothetical protein
MIRLDTGGGVLATFCIVTIGTIALIWFIAEVVAPILCWGPCT